MKKVLSFLLCVLMVVGMLPVQVVAVEESATEVTVETTAVFTEETVLPEETMEDVVSEPAENAISSADGIWKYRIVGINVWITAYNGSASELTVPGKIDGLTVVGIDPRAFKNNTELKSIAFPDTLKEIGYEAFWGCRSLTSITLPENLTKIGYDAFTNCTGLEKIVVKSKNLNDFSSSGVFGCAGMNAENGIAVEFAETVTRIPAYMFDCGSNSYARIKTVAISSKVKSIGKSAFECCYDLTSVSIPENSELREIGTYAFGSCLRLTSITLPEKLEDLGYYAFDNCAGLEKITVKSTKLDVYSHSISSSEFNNAGANAENGLAVEFTDTATLIDENMFACEADRYAHVKNVIIGSQVANIGENAFYNCFDLATIYFSGNAPTIGNNAFYKVTATAYYPMGDATWTAAVRKGYGGNITWVPLCMDHDIMVIKGYSPTCTNAGLTDGKKCSACGEILVAQEIISAKGHQWGNTSCTSPKKCSVCGATGGQAVGHTYSNNVDGTCNACGVHRENVETRKVVHMFRMYNPNTGEHFYTGSTVERDNLIVEGWQYEGVGFTFPENTGDPVHRLFQPSTGEHLYTMDESEKERLMAQGWNYEGVAFNSAYDTEAVQHRLHNPNASVGAYHFTFSEEERQNLIKAGWEYQGIGWYSCWK